ncbi:unnamed protein product [Notodromas monacha]|uniref:ATP synthase subunit f, mitochondrial n=1 Tax=Notodromas monacha TaxID=399045 RepID=A0A7R9BFY2_9CRUS|nr:unnamed protein product [Notodromas monacha]CAG0913124.1 unnamed protein product [Notodromas monacha]
MSVYDLLAKMGMGQLPEGYNKKIHGPYNPARYYGKPDIPLGQVKIKELGPWLARRNKDPVSIARLMSRGYHRWSQKYILARTGGLAGYTQLLVGISLFFYTINYCKYANHRNYKYHW